MDLIDEDGKHFEAGKMDLWKGQHNVEYIGNDEYAMFDDESNVNWWVFRTHRAWMVPPAPCWPPLHARTPL